MMDIGIKEPKVPCIYWAIPKKEIIYFHLNDPKMEVAVHHRSDPIGYSERIVRVEDLVIDGICWESFMITVFRLFGMDPVIKLDMFGNTCEWFLRIISRIWRVEE